MPRTLYQKLWDNHVITTIDDKTSLLYVDLHMIHEVTSPQAFANLRKYNRKVRRTDRTFATIDHNVPTTDQYTISDQRSRAQIETLKKNCEKFIIELYGLDSPNQGIVHIIGPQLGLTQPGMTIVCGDSHTSTHGAFGCLAFGIGTTEIEQVLATQCLLQQPMKTMEIRIEGALGKGVTAKDVILTILSKIGTKGGVGYCFEYTGSAIRAMTMEERMTICNMSIEGGARAGLVAPDKITYEYVAGRPYAPKGKRFEEALTAWKQLVTDPGSEYDTGITINAYDMEPLITYGTDPSTGIKVHQSIPDPELTDDQDKRQTLEKSLKYMNLHPGQTLENFPIDYVFIGSCTNARISDLRDAAKIIKGNRIKPGIHAWIVPGSRHVKKQAEEEGLHKIFTDAGFEWRWSGCSACIAMNDDKIPAGKYCVSTSNRNYEGRQGPGARTFLASPIMAAAAAIEGKIVDVRKFL